MQKKQLEQFNQILTEGFQSGKLVKITLSKPRNKQSALRNIVITPVKLREGIMMHFVSRFATRDEARNYSINDALQLISEALDNVFFNADMYLQDRNVRVMLDKKGEAKLLVNKISSPLTPEFSHDRVKQRLVKTLNNPWLVHLGICNQQGEVRREMTDKYLQINRYIELLEPVIEKLEPFQNLTLADMGSGKGYLTFALYQYLTETLRKSVSMTGVEYRSDLVVKCNTVAALCGLKGLSFRQGTIENTTIEPVDVLIALHACDTATDDAIFRGISDNASVIVCAPCCHKQVRNSMKVPNRLNPMLKHGILLQRQAEMVTDAIRALMMEAWGYSTRVFEFIPLEHTAKNVMIVGRKTGTGLSRKEVILEQISELKEMFGVKYHYLEKLLGV